MAKAVAPDNLKVPTGLFVKTKRRSKTVSTKILCATTIPTFTATIDDLLSATSIAEKTLSVVRNLEKKAQQQSP